MPIKKTSLEDLVQTCKEVFHRKGYYNTSMADLAQACGLLKGSFYHYFPGKEDIMKAVLRDSHTKLKEQALSVVHDEDRAPKEKLSWVLGCIGGQVSMYKSCLYGNTVLETSLLVPDFRSILQEVFDDIQAALQTIYLTKYTPEESKKRAMSSTQQLQGAVMMMKLYDDVAILQEAQQAIVDEF